MNFPEENPHAFTVELNADATEPELQDNGARHHLQSREYTFDVSDIDFPENVAVRSQVCLIDNHSTPPIVLKRDIRIPLTYYIDGEQRRQWRDHTPHITKRNHIHKWLNIHGHTQFQEDGHTVTYYLGSNPSSKNQAWAASHVIKTEAMQEYGANGDSGWLKHCIEETNSAHQKPHMRQFARQIWDAQTTAGATDPLDRLNAVARLAAGINYEKSGSEGARKPEYALFAQRGNCSEKTYLFAAILRCPPFETRVGYIYGENSAGGAHAVGGVEVAAFEDTSHDISDHNTMYPSDYDDTPSNHYEAEFSFIELTNPHPIGKHKEHLFAPQYFYGTNFNKDHDWELENANN